MLKGLFRGWVSSVISEKANKDLREAQIRDKPQKARPFLLPPLLLQPVNQRRVQHNRINRSDARKAHCRSHACKRRAVLLTTLPCAILRGRHAMGSISLVNHWGLLTHWRVLIPLFMFEVTRNVRMWNSLVAATLVKQYGREEVRVITDADALRRSSGHVLSDIFKTGRRTCEVF